MAEKRIAVFCTGWGSEITYAYCKGALEGLKGSSTDLIVFMSYALISDEPEELKAGINIFNLPDLSTFAGALVLGNTLDFGGVFDEIVLRCKKAGIPCVTTGRRHPDAYYVGADNYPGQLELANHLFDKHRIGKPLFIAGNPENPDSNSRLRAFKDAAMMRGIDMKEDDVFYSNWDPNAGGERVARMLEGPEEDRYDAVICANDSLAITVATVIKNHGFRIPEDVIVTGFDNESSAKLFFPSISSVDQRFEVLGKQAALTILDDLIGFNRDKIQEFPCKFVVGESCGCANCEDMNEMRRTVCTSLIMDKRAATLFDRFVETMDRYVFGCNDINEIHEILCSMIPSMRDFFGDTFHVLLDPLYEKSTTDLLVTPRKLGYGRKMCVLYSEDRNKVIPRRDFDTIRVIPQNIAKREDRFYVVLPIHDEGFTYGYVAFGDRPEIMQSLSQIANFLNRFGMILSKFKQNKNMIILNAKLTEVSETDALTHVKSRTAYEAKEKEMNIFIKESGSEFAIAMFDVNYLKDINDEFGHDYGDVYLKNSCNLICKVFKQSPVYRMGGDEFMAILSGEDYEKRDELLAEFRASMEEMSGEDVPVEERVSIASGIAVFDRKTDKNVASVLKRADDLMYENKAVMKGNKNIR